MKINKYPYRIVRRYDPQEGWMYFPEKDFRFFFGLFPSWGSFSKYMVMGHETFESAVKDLKEQIELQNNMSQEKIVIYLDFLGNKINE
jgi:hypothetical protein